MQPTHDSIVKAVGEAIEALRAFLAVPPERWHDATPNEYFRFDQSDDVSIIVTDEGHGWANVAVQLNGVSFGD